MNKEFENTMWFFSNKIRGLSGSANEIENIFCLLFLKWSMDNRTFATNEEQLNALLDLQMSTHDINGISRECLVNYIEKTYNCFNGEYAFTRTLLDVYEQIGFKDGRIWSSLWALNLKDSGEIILDYFDEKISNSGRIYSEVSSNNSLANLAIKILNPQSGELCYDPFVGTGVFISKLPQEVSSIGNDINPKTLMLATIRCIIAKKNNVQLQLNDAYLNDFSRKHKADLVFNDGPINVKLKHDYVMSYMKSYKDIMGNMLDSNILSILMTLESLNDKGRAFVTVPSGVLFKEQKAYVQLRKYLLENNYIDAVIELPSMWSATAIQTNVLVLSKNKKDKSVVFVSAGTNEYFNFTQKQRLSNQLTPEGIDMILDIVTNKKEIDNISEVKRCLDIVVRSETLVVNRHVVPVKVTNYRPVEQIDKEIKEVWNALLKNMEN